MGLVGERKRSVASTLEFGDGILEGCEVVLQGANDRVRDQFTPRENCVLGSVKGNQYEPEACALWGVLGGLQRN